MNPPSKRASRSEAQKFLDHFLSLGSQLPARTPSRSKARLILDNVLTDDEAKAAYDRAWQEEFGTGHQTTRKGGSIYRYAFLQSYYMGEKRLEKLGQLELFRNTQRLPDYRRAEDAVKRGWGRWIELEFGIEPDQAKNKLKIKQYQLLKGTSENYFSELS